MGWAAAGCTRGNRRGGILCTADKGEPTAIELKQHLIVDKGVLAVAPKTAELAPTQAAAIVLGISSAAHSHTFVYACVWDAIRLTDVPRGGGAFLSDPALPEPERASGADDTSSEAETDDAATKVRLRGRRRESRRDF